MQVAKKSVRSLAFVSTTNACCARDEKVWEVGARAVHHQCCLLVVIVVAGPIMVVVWVTTKYWT